MEIQMWMDAWFPVAGARLPADHGYVMYGALCRVNPELHEFQDWGLHTIGGVRDGAGYINLRRARLGLRIAANELPRILPLAGQTFEVDGCRFSLGMPMVEPLHPAPSLTARMVTIKGFLEPEPFATAVQAQLSTLGISSPFAIGPRRILRVDGRNIVGFSVAVDELEEDASLSLMVHGLGGRRRFGCGLFRRSMR